MSRTYFSILTNYGEQAIATAVANNTPLRLATMAIGDGNGMATIPQITQVALKREVYRAQITDLLQDEGDSKQVIAELLVPENVGGFTVREVGLFDEQGGLIAVANCPDNHKPILESGTGKVQYYRIVLKVSSNDAVTLSINNNIVYATRTEFTRFINNLSESDGFKYIGQCESIAELRTIEPTQDQQRILVKSYYEGKNKGGGVFYADFTDTTTTDNGGTVIVTVGGKRWKRVFKALTIYDFGVKADGIFDDTNSLKAIATFIDVVDLQGAVCKTSYLPVGCFVNGEIIVNDKSHFFSLYPMKKNGLRIASWNVWSSGSTNRYFDTDRFSPRRFAELKNNLVKLNADIVGLQETHHSNTAFKLERYCVGRLNTSVASISADAPNGDKYGNILLGNNAVDHRSKQYDSPVDEVDSELRSYVNAIYQHDDKRISVYNTHLALSENRRNQMIAELCETVLADSADVIFIMGDFNTSNWSLFTSLTNAGFKQVNNNTFDTNPNENEWFIDDIFYRGATLTNSGIWTDLRIGDHSAIFGDFQI